MSNYRSLLAAQTLSALAFILAVVTDFGVASSAGISPRTTGISALILAIAAFAAAWRTGSLIVSGFLILQGMVDVSSSISAGVEIGVIFGAIPLILGLIKAVLTWRARASRSDRKVRYEVNRQRLTS
jgi:hypothetical protein